MNEHGKLDVRRAVGTDGTLSVVKDLGLREFFTGQVEIVSGELGKILRTILYHRSRFLLL